MFNPAATLASVASVQDATALAEPFQTFQVASANDLPAMRSALDDTVVSTTDRPAHLRGRCHSRLRLLHPLGVSGWLAGWLGCRGGCRVGAVAACPLRVTPAL